MIHVTSNKEDDRRFGLDDGKRAFGKSNILRRNASTAPLPKKMVMPIGEISSVGPEQLT
jgi:hypothetical protein